MRRTWGYNLKSDILSRDWFCQLSALRQLLLFILCYWARGWEQTRRWWFPGVAWMSSGAAIEQPDDCSGFLLATVQMSVIRRQPYTELVPQRLTGSRDTVKMLQHCICLWWLEYWVLIGRSVNMLTGITVPIIWWSLVLSLKMLYLIKWKNNHQINH